MEDTAIQEDVVEEVAEEQQEEVKAQPLERDLVADSVAEKVRAQRDALEKDEEPEEPVEDPDELIDLHVNGEVIQKTRAEVDAGGGVVEMQKSLTADMRLEQAAEERKALMKQKAEQEERERLLQEAEAKLAAQETQQEDPIDYEEKLKNLADAIYSGDQEELVAALKEAKIGSPTKPAPQLNQQDLDAIVENKLRATAFETSKKEGNAEFAKKYAHLKNDPAVFQIAQQKTIELAQEHPDWMPAEVIMEAGKLTDEWLNDLRGEKPPTETETRQEKKRNMHKVPAAHARQKQEAGFKPKTKEEIMAEFRQSRKR